MPNLISPSEIKANENKKKFNWWVVPVIATSLGVGAIIGGGAVAWSGQDVIAGSKDSRLETLHKLEIFGRVLSIISKEYVVEPDTSKLINSALNGMLSSLDPHSSYESPEDFLRQEEQVKGEYDGLGLEVTSDRGAVKVITPMDNSPAVRAGVKAGDLIIAIDGQSIIGLTLSESTSRMKGKKGTSVTLTIVRGAEKPILIKVVRDKIIQHSVTHRVEGNVGYIRISNFINENTTSEFNIALDNISKSLGAKLKGVVIDLRNNGGGLLTQAVGVSDALIDRGEIVSSRGRRPESLTSLKATAGEKLVGVPIVVLIDGGTASASEIVAGALQDYKRATIIGMTSFGKGSVQTVLPFNNGKDGALRLTTSRYYTPAGRSIQGAGIVPDVEISHKFITQSDVENQKLLSLGEEDLPNALVNDSGAKRAEPHMPADMPPENWNEADDYQLLRAFQFLELGAKKSDKLPPLKVVQAKIPEIATTKESPVSDKK